MIKEVFLINCLSVKGPGVFLLGTFHNGKQSLSKQWAVSKTVLWVGQGEHAVYSYMHAWMQIIRI